MTDYNSMTKKELIGLAGAKQIVGRHSMSKDQLAAALQLAEVVELKAQEDVVIPANLIKQAKRKNKSFAPRDESGKVIRRGKNLSGNSPYRRKHYYLSPKFANEKSFPEGYMDSLAAAPCQVRLILKTMRQFKITSPSRALIGQDIVQKGLDNKVLETKSDPANLFAYYARTLELLGVTVGENEEGDEE